MPALFMCLQCLIEAYNCVPLAIHYCNYDVVIGRRGTKFIRLLLDYYVIKRLQFFCLVLVSFVLNLRFMDLVSSQFLYQCGISDDEFASSAFIVV